MIRRLTLTALSFVLVAASAEAQQPVNCSALTVTQARGLTCHPDYPPIGATPAAKPVLGTPLLDGTIDPSPADCDPRPNPYEDAARAARCILWERAQKPRPPLPVFEIGAVYAHPYQAVRMTVLSIGQSVEGVPVVTAQYISGAFLEGIVFAFRVDQGVPWTKVEP